MKNKIIVVILILLPVIDMYAMTNPQQVGVPNITVTQQTAQTIYRLLEEGDVDFIQQYLKLADLADFDIKKSGIRLSPLDIVLSGALVNYMNNSQKIDQNYFTAYELLKNAGVKRIKQDAFLDEIEKIIAPPKG